MQIKQSYCVLRAFARRKHLHLTRLALEPTCEFGRLYTFLPTRVPNLDGHLRSQSLDLLVAYAIRLLRLLLCRFELLLKRTQSLIQR